MNRLPAALPATRAPWATPEDDEAMEELDDEDEEALGSIGELPQRAEAGSVALCSGHEPTVTKSSLAGPLESANPR